MSRITKTSSIKVIALAVLSIAVLIVSQTIAILIGDLLVSLKVPIYIANIVICPCYIALSYILLKIIVRKLIKLPLSDFGMPKFNLKISYIALALLLPISVIVFYLFAFKGSFITGDNSTANILNTLSAGIAFTGIAAGFVEEMVFRGMILNLLKKRWNTPIAVILPSVIFGLLHLPGEGYGIISSLLVIFAGTIVGIMFSLIAIESGSVWNSGIVHALWNILISGGGLTIGCEANEYSILSFVLDNKSFAFTGGEFGIEASIISVIAYLLVILITLYFMSVKRKKSS